jgi:DNA-binding XRE family transcriptional regulator
MSDDPLVASTKRLATATAAREKARQQHHDLIRAQLAAGRMQADIARVTGYTRETIRQIGRDKPTTGAAP